MSKRIAGPMLPVMVREITFSRAAVAANLRGVSLRDFADQALDAAITKAEQAYEAELHARECRDARARNSIAPTRHEFDQDRQRRVSAGKVSGLDVLTRARRAEVMARRQPTRGRETPDDMPPDDWWGPLPGEAVQPAGVSPGARPARFTTR